MNQISKKLSASISSLWEAMIERRAFRYWIVGFTLLAEKMAVNKAYFFKGTPNKEGVTLETK